MTRRIALCLDARTCQEPALIGLQGEALDGQEWLEVLHEAESVRRACQLGADFEEIWVVTCDDIEPINLCAALKIDRPDLRVCLVSFETSGSLYSRAHTAGVDEILDGPAFVSRYGNAKQRYRNASTLPGLGFQPGTMNDLPTQVLERSQSMGAQQGSVAMAASMPTMPVEQAAQPQPAARPLALQTSPSRSGRIPTHMKEPQPLGLPSPSDPHHKGIVLTVVSGSGGAGKSTVSVLAAALAAQRGLRTLLLDYDLQFGDAALMAGYPSALSVEEVLEHPEKLRAQFEHPSALTVIAAPERLETAELVVDSLPGLLENLSGHFDVIVANTGAAWAEQHAALLERSSAALFLVDQRSSSIRGCLHAVELCSRCGIAAAPFRFALNRCSKNAPFSATDVSAILNGVPITELRDGGDIVEECLSAGAVDELLSSGNDLVRSIDKLLDGFLPRTQAESNASTDKDIFHGFKRRSRSERKRGKVA